MHRTYPSPAEAQRIERALAPDQDGFVRATRDGADLDFLIEAEDAASARRTVEDLLACLTTAEKTVAVSEGRSAAR